MSGSRVAAISVALCTYNGEAFVAEQLRTILNQETPALEVVISDDGSTDRTLAIIGDVAKKPRGPTEIRVVNKTRIGGVTRNFDRTIAACRGDIVVLSDQDDAWEPHRLCALDGLFEGGRPRMVFSDASLMDGHGDPLPGSLHRSLRLSRRERRDIRSGKAFDVLIRRNVVTGAVAAFSKELYALASPLPDTWVHDEWLAIIAAAMGEVTLLDEELVRYRLHAGNQIGVADPGPSARARRMLEPRGDRYTRLKERAEALIPRLEDLGAPPEIVALAQRKFRFETARAAYPDSHLRRIGPITKQAVRGSYGRLSSQRRLDIIRDLLQPALPSAR